MMRTLIVSSMVLASGSSIAAAQAGRLEDRLDPATRASVVALVDSARGVGLPVEPLIDKALEGSSKGASPARIVAAVRALRDNLASTRRLLGAGATTAELVAGASVLRVGLDGQALRDLRALRPGGSLAVPLVVLADLIDRGVPPDTAAALVARLTASDAGDIRLAELRREVARDITDGVPPAVAAVLRTRGVLVAIPARGTPTAVGADGAAKPGTLGNSKP